MAKTDAPQKLMLELGWVYCRPCAESEPEYQLRAIKPMQTMAIVWQSVGRWYIEIFDTIYQARTLAAAQRKAERILGVKRG